MSEMEKQIKDTDKALEEYFIIDFYLAFRVINDTGLEIKYKIKIFRDEPNCINLHKRDLHFIEYLAEKIYLENKAKDHFNDFLFVNIRLINFKEYWKL